MTPDDVYRWTPISVDRHPHHVATYCDGVPAGWVDLAGTTRVVEKTYVDERFDDRRGMAFFSVWFDRTPVMIVQAAGRELRDVVKTFVTDRAGYAALCGFLAARSATFDARNADVLDPRKPLRPERKLFQFYAKDVRELYDPRLKVPRCRKGDVVQARIGRVVGPADLVGPVRIEEVRPHRLTSTYRAVMLDYRRAEDSLAFVHDPGNGNFTISLAESDVLPPAKPRNRTRGRKTAA